VLLLSPGVSVAGMSEESTARVTYGIAMSVATTLARLNPQMTFIFVSGAGTDSTGGDARCGRA
jgi:hypothetical protein